MKKIYISFTLLLLFTNKIYSQVSDTTVLSAKDSIKILQEVMELLNAANNPASYIMANIGFGNRLFSINNNALNAKQATGRLIYTPTVGYFHKSGLGLTAGINMLQEVKGLDINQYSISPSYELAGNHHMDFGISYTRYFVKDKFSVYSSPIQNDLYTSFIYKKKWLQPGIGLGYSSGEYKESIKKDTTINNIHRRLYDSITYRFKAFSAIFTLGHSYTWYGVLTKKDGLKFTHTIMANAGSSKTSITHKTNAQYLYNFLNRRRKIPKLHKEKFEIQSVGLSLDVNYAIGNFILEPLLYLDYYLQDTSEKKFSPVFTFNIGYIF